MTFHDSAYRSDNPIDVPGSSGPTATVQADPTEVGSVRTSYAPDRDGDPDPPSSSLAVQLSSKQHDRDHEWVALGAGPWDSSGRPSWADLDRVLRVHEDGMRREACALDLERFDRVVGRLRERYGWS
ncbi:type II toxin-antitoxin system PemK/MazF family toxin [Streptomyces globisporus]|uniref:Type II toxin-antitoxin system PemK/MazF family toxin n=1 Tax=Streptomyces globisporus TaxID=1908 RepID=A0A423UU94_STRGL|nr:type II toxin-antitoxin system PemK/MazF family toxin [Streptomyces globisporus]ROV65909.1 type II toxin-antitoxin system PemK/MazF family toxin [Streptomyces globisporus]